MLYCVVLSHVGKREDVEFSREVIAVINEAVYNHIGEPIETLHESMLCLCNAHILTGMCSLL